MPAQGLVRVVMQADARQLRAALNGAVGDSRRADQATRTSAAQAERAKIQATAHAERERVRSVQRGAQERTRIEGRAAREAAQIERRRMAERERLNRQQSREAQRSAGQRAREHRTALRGESAAMGAMGATGLGVGGAAIGAFVAAINGVFTTLETRLQTISSAMGSRAGVMDEGQRVASAQDFELQMARSSGEFFQGQDPAQTAESMHALQEEILGVAQASSQSPMALLNTLAMMQTEFSQFAEGRANLEAIANEATRTGAEMEGLARFVGVVNHQLGATAPNAARLFDIMAEQGLQGSLSPEQLSNDFGGMFGQFTEMSGLEGEDAVRQFGAMANALKSKDVSSSEAATLMQNMLTGLGDGATLDRLREATGGHQVGRGADRHWEGGTSAIRADGTFDMAQLVEDMSRVEGIGTSDVVFHDSQARQAAGQLASLARRDRSGEDVVTMAELQGVDAGHGAALRSSNLATVQGTSAMLSRRIGIGGEIEGIRSLPSTADEGNARLVAQEAGMRDTGALAFRATLQSALPDWAVERFLPQAADAASGSANVRQYLATSQADRPEHFRLNMDDALQQLLGIGDTQRTVRQESRQRDVKIDRGSLAELGQVIAAAVRTPTTPTRGRTPSETGT